MGSIRKDTHVVIIFGGDGYVGTATAVQFEQSGWIAVRASRKVANDSTHVRSDICDSTSVTETFNSTVSLYGRLDAVVHAASPTLERVPFVSASPESFLLHVETAVLGTMHIAQAAIRAGAKNIVVITSKATDATSSKMGAYPFAKRAQHELCATLAKTLPQTIRIHTVAPGFLPGGLNTDLPQSVREKFALRTDGTKAEVSEIAHIIVDICEQKPAYDTNGTVDGATGVMTPF